MKPLLNMERLNMKTVECGQLDMHCDFWSELYFFSVGRIAAFISVDGNDSLSVTRSFCSNANQRVGYFHFNKLCEFREEIIFHIFNSQPIMSFNADKFRFSLFFVSARRRSENLVRSLARMICSKINRRKSAKDDINIDVGVAQMEEKLISIYI